jgi:hypothetical protein
MNDVTKLPKWAQEQMRSLTLQRDAAVRELRTYTDNQTMSAFFTRDMVCDKEGGPTIYHRYVQAHDMCVEHQGVHMDIYLRDDGINIQYGIIGRGGPLDDVILQPKSFQNFTLKLPA